MFGVVFRVHQQEGEIWPPPRKLPRSLREEARREKACRKETRRKETRREKGNGEKTGCKKGGSKETRREAQAQRRVHEGDDAVGELSPPSSARSPMPRTEVTKKIWDYIKKNKLQDSINRRLINADEKLRAVFGGKGKVSMFEMTKLVSNHLK